MGSGSMTSTTTLLTLLSVAILISVPHAKTAIYFRIKSLLNGYVIDLKDKCPEYNNRIVMMPSDGSRSQYWEHHNGTMIRNACSGMYLTMDPTYHHRGHPILTMWRPHGGPAQRFCFKDDRTITMKDTDNCLTVVGANRECNADVVVQKCEGPPRPSHQMWEVIYE